MTTPTIPNIPGPPDVIAAVAASSGFSVRDLTSYSRMRPLHDYRMVAMAACRMATSASYPSIGRAFGGRDHSTVMHACRRVERDPQLASMARRVADEVRGKEDRDGLPPGWVRLVGAGGAVVPVAHAKEVA